MSSLLQHTPMSLLYYYACSCVYPMESSCMYVSHVVRCPYIQGCSTRLVHDASYNIVIAGEDTCPRCTIVELATDDSNLPCISIVITTNFFLYRIQTPPHTSLSSIVLCLHKTNCINRSIVGYLNKLYKQNCINRNVVKKYYKLTEVLYRSIKLKY